MKGAIREAIDRAVDRGEILKDKSKGWNRNNVSVINLIKIRLSFMHNGEQKYLPVGDTLLRWMGIEGYSIYSILQLVQIVGIDRTWYKEIGVLTEEFTNILTDDMPFEDFLFYFGEYNLELAEILYELNPQVYRDIGIMGIWDHMGSRFVNRIKDTKSRLPRIDLTPQKEQRAIQGLIEKLELKIQAVEDKEIQKRVYSRAVALAGDLEKKRYAGLFEEEGFEVGNSKIQKELQEAKDKGADLKVAGLEQAKAYYGDIKALREKIKRLGILKEGVELNVYQLRSVYRMVEEKKLILGEDMGLGKTIESLVYAWLVLIDEEKEGEGEILIAVPTNLARDAFMRDLNKLIAKEVQVVIVGPEGEKYSYPAIEDRVHLKSATSEKDKEDLLLGEDSRLKGITRIQIWTYTQLRGRDELLKEAKIDVLVADEAHNLKHGDTLQSMAIRTIDSANEIYATGTPVDNDIEDVRVLLEQTLEAVGRSKKEPEWMEEFKIVLQSPSAFKKWLNQRASIEQIGWLHQVLKQKMIRNKKEDVMRDKLPNRREEDVLYRREEDVLLDLEKGIMRWQGEEILLVREGEIDPFAKERELYKRVYELLKKHGMEQYQLAGIQYLRWIYTDVQSMVKRVKGYEEPGILSEEILKIIEDIEKNIKGEWVSIKNRALEVLEERIKEEGEKAVVFSCYREDVKNNANRLGDRAAYIVGGMQGREAILRGFQENGVYDFLYTTYGPVGVSVNLDKARYGIFKTLPDKSSTKRQAEDRFYRRADDDRDRSGEEVFIIDIIVEGKEGIPSVDEWYKSVIERKHLIAMMLEDGQISGPILEAFSDIEEHLLNRFFQRIEVEEDEMEELNRKIGDATKSQYMGDNESAKAIWDDIADTYSDNLEQLSTHTQEIGIFLTLLQMKEEGLLREKGIRIGDGGEVRIGSVPSGPAICIRSLWKLRKQFQDYGWPIIDKDGKKKMAFYGYDFSSGMLERGKDAVKDYGVELHQELTDVTENELGLVEDGGLDIVESGMIGYFTDLENEDGISRNVWALSQMVKKLKVGGVLILSSHSKRIPDRVVEVLENRFNLKEIDSQKRRQIRFSEGRLEEILGDKEVAKELESHLNDSSVVFFVKQGEMDYNIDNLQSISGEELKFEDWYEEEDTQGKGRLRIRGISRDKIDLSDVDWEKVGVDTIKMIGGVRIRAERKRIHASQRLVTLGEIDKELKLNRAVSNLTAQVNETYKSGHFSSKWFNDFFAKKERLTKKELKFLEDMKWGIERIKEQFSEGVIYYEGEGEIEGANVIRNYIDYFVNVQRVIEDIMQKRETGRGKLATDVRDIRGTRSGI